MERGYRLLSSLHLFGVSDEVVEALLSGVGFFAFLSSPTATPFWTAFLRIDIPTSMGPPSRVTRTPSL